MKRRVAIIGGGISGLTAAYLLQRDHAETCVVTLFEASDRFGGIIETVHKNGFVIECGPDSWVTEKPWAEQLARELGLGSELRSSNDTERVTYIAQQGSLLPLPAGMRMMVPSDLVSVLASPLFSSAARLAYQQEPARAAELRDAALLQRGEQADESVAAFVERHFGPEVTETVAGPLLAGVFGGDIHKLSARALLAPFVAMEAEHGSLIAALQAGQRDAARRDAGQSEPAAGIFTTLSSGLQTLVERLVDAMPAESLLRSMPVLSLRQRGFAWEVTTPSGVHSFDRVVIATPLDATRRLLASLPMPEAVEASTCLPEQASSSVVVALGYHAAAARSIAIPPGFGFLVPPSKRSAPDNRHQGSSLLACTFLHQKFAQRVPHGAMLLRAFFSGNAAEALAAHSDGQIAATATAELTQLLGALPSADIALVRRWPRSLPQYEIGHVSRMQRFATVPTLLPIGNAYRGVGLPDLVRDAADAARRVAFA